MGKGRVRKGGLAGAEAGKWIKGTEVWVREGLVDFFYPVEISGIRRN